MEPLLSLLAILPDDWSIPWAGIGTVLLGIGGVLSGIAAIITARNRGRDEKTVSTPVSRSVDDVRRRISGSDSPRSGVSGTDEDSYS